MNYAYDKEVYFRAVSSVRRKLLSKEDSFFCTKLLQSGRTMPSVIRPDERAIFPNSLRATESLSFLTGLICIEEWNDLALSEVVDHFLLVARKNKYNGGWKVWKDLIEYFSLSDEDNWNTDRDFTIFSLPDYFDFLLTIMSEDDLFGNHLRVSIRLMSNLHVKKRKFPADDKPVKKPQRHRGYRDKGSCADYNKGCKEGESSSRRHILPPEAREPKYSSLDQVLVFEAPKPVEGGE